MIVCFLLCLIFMAPSAYAEDNTWTETAHGGFSITVTLPQTEITLLDELHVFVTLTYPEIYHIDIGRLRSKLLYHSASSDAPFSLESEIVPPQIKSDQNSITQKIVFTLDPQYAGKHALTFFMVPFEPNDPKKNSKTELISPIFYATVTMPPASKIEKPLTAPLMTFSTNFPIDMDTENRRSLLGSSDQSRNVQIFREKSIPWVGFLALAGAFILIFTFGKPKVNPEKIKAKKQATVKQKAIQELTVLRQQIRDKHYDTFYVIITRTVREFIEGRYNIKANSLTTEEFLQEMAVHPIFSEKTQKLLKSFLESADKVKYANAEASEHDCEEALKIANTLIRLD